MTVERVVCGHSDQFPVGMRVLAVDDDPTCLRLLETLLRRCQYNVTTTNQAITALHLLRDNKNKYDLVISDVHMPDMDGFKLLELVGLEMDLPVIMLSANGDTKLVMKGIAHGACDYLLKPVRIEELKNIWQHVVRRKKIDVKDCNNYDGPEKSHFGNCEIAESGNSDHSGKLNKKRKDNEDVCEEHDENGNENEDPSTQKKPRVVWSVELHGKFVAAVRQLGIDKAVPKKILELMNVDKLTRENVASHLQKYRLYLKRISLVANQQAHMAVALSGTDSQYFRMDSLNGYGNLNSLAPSNQLSNGAYRPFSSSGMLGRLNSPAGLGLHGLPSSGMTRLSNLENSSKVNNEQSKVVIPEDCKGAILQGMPMSLELDELQHKGVISVGGLPSVVDSVGASSVSSSFMGPRITGHKGNPVHCVPNYPVLLEGHVQETKGVKLPGDQLSVPGASNKELPSHMLDLHRCSDNWSSAVPSGLQSNIFPSNDHCLRQVSSHPNELRDSSSAMAVQNSSSLTGFSSIPPVRSVLDSWADLKCQALPRSCNNSGQIIKDMPQQWDAPYRPHLMHNSINSSAAFNGAITPSGQDMEQSNMLFSRNLDLDSITQANFADPLFMKCNEVGGLAMEMPVDGDRGYLGGHQKAHGSYSLSSIDSLEDLASALMKQEQVKFSEGDLGGRAYSFRTGI